MYKNVCLYIYLNASAKKKIAQQDEHCSNIAIKLCLSNFYYNQIDTRRPLAQLRLQMKVWKERES